MEVRFDRIPELRISSDGLGGRAPDDALDFAHYLGFVIMAHYPLNGVPGDVVGRLRRLTHLALLFQQEAKETVTFLITEGVSDLQAP
jgi:hypothetical protein